MPGVTAALGHSSNVLIVSFDVRADWEQWILHSSDEHHDNLHCRQDLEREHLEKAKARKALVFKYGDTFCAMQGKYDPRSNMDDIRPEDVGVDYLDRIVKHAAEFYAPYAQNLVLLGKGNHETNILNRMGTDLTSQLATRLKDAGGNTFIGGYGGWVILRFVIFETQKQSMRIKYHHGSGGGGPVTRGVIGTNRQAVYLPDADVVVNGHTHDAYIVPIRRERVTPLGAVSLDYTYYLRTPGYKDEYGDGSRGWAVERGMAPKPQGAIWQRLYVRKESGAHQAHYKIYSEFTTEFG